MKRKFFERRGREGFAENAKEMQKGFFCVFRVTFASSAFKKGCLTL